MFQDLVPFAVNRAGVEYHVTTVFPNVDGIGLRLTHILLVLEEQLIATVGCLLGQCVEFLHVLFAKRVDERRTVATLVEAHVNRGDVIDVVAAKTLVRDSHVVSTPLTW